MRNMFLVLALVATLLMLPLGTHAASKDIRVDGKEVVYPLPYPGILADHPLYPLKRVRDAIILFTTRDMLKKAELSLQFSDKHIANAIGLAEKGKEQLAIDELKRAEHTAQTIPGYLQTSKEQGAAASNDFIMKLFQSNEKHKEVITELMKKMTQAQIDTLNDLLKKNAQIKKDISSVNK